MKYRTATLRRKTEEVAPLAGAWIEISFASIVEIIIVVAPLAGAWIEISLMRKKKQKKKSLPSRERGLKYVWYEISVSFLRRSPRGSVD